MGRGVLEQAKKRRETILAEFELRKNDPAFMENLKCKNGSCRTRKEFGDTSPLKQHGRTNLRFTDGFGDGEARLRAIAVPKDVMKSFQQGEKFYFRSGAKDPLVMCTANSTFTIQKHIRRCVCGCTTVAPRISKSVSFALLSIRACTLPFHAETSTVRRLLKEYELHHVDDEELTDISDDLNHQKRYSIRQLLRQLPISEGELRAFCKRLPIIDVDGKLVWMTPQYCAHLLDVLVDLFDEDTASEVNELRCLQNIIGVILYIRLAWVCGQAGILMALFILLLASLVTIVTTISTAAITTNGEVKGGGVYYMISRTLGPEFGGSIGLLFCCANAVAAALYIVGLAETVVDFLRDHNWSLFDETNEVRVIGVATCIILMAIICIGISIESKLQQIMLIPFTLSMICFIAGTFIHTETKEKKGFTGYSAITFKENLLPSNILKPNCTGTCQYGLMNDYQVMSEISAWPPMILIGILASTLSSALASLVSAPKIFQAVAADNLFPYITWLKKGYGADNAPRRAYALTFAITVGMILIGKLDLIAPIISNFFLCTYTLVNYACFDASYSNSPDVNWGSSTQANHHKSTLAV
ncbi:unnamed protein product, partial [Mesorhabditis spiculigera]